MPTKILAPLLVVASLLTSCSRESQELVLSGPTMGTTYSVKVVGTPATLDATAIRGVIDEVLASVDVEMSTYRSDSSISKFNASASTDWIAVPRGLAQVVKESRVVSERSQGAFDITIGPLIQAWGFGAAGEPVDSKALPTENDIATLRERMGYARLEVRMDPAALRKQHPLLAIDVNGAAPGYAVDLLASRFASLGLSDFMIDIGGEVLARGRNARGERWRIAVERPLDGDPQPFRIIELDNQSITTSGEYRHFFELDGQRYSHTIDPRSGHPIRSGGSVAIVGRSSLEIDAWATALNVLGPDDGIALAEREGLPVMYIVVVDGKLAARTSRAFDSQVKIIDSSR